MSNSSQISLTAAEAVDILGQLRRLRSDNDRVEAKGASGGLPKSVWNTVSAFANTAGGTIMLGVDESSGFAVVPELNVEKLANQLIEGLDECPGKAAKVDPVPFYRVGELQVESGVILVLEIDALREDPRMLGRLPCHVRDKGVLKGSFKRVFDHDQLMSTYEIHELQSRAGEDRTDRQPVTAADLEDLNVSAATDLINRMRAQGSRIADAADGPEEILNRLNVLTRSGEGLVPTFAGLMSLGWYPQQFFPQLFIDVTSHPGVTKSTGENGIRFESRRICDGPMPNAIETAVTEVLARLRTRVREQGAGVIEEPEIPDIAIREAISNAVMHRDYGDFVRGQQIAVDIYTDRVEVTNPGGLWGDRTLENLGENRSVSRNEVLAKLLSQVVDSEGRRVAENQGSGIQRMVGALRNHGLPAPKFQDDIGFFKVSLPRFGLIGPEVHGWLESLPGIRTRAQDVAMVIAKDLGAVTVKQLREHLGIDSDEARQELHDLERSGQLRKVGPDRYTLDKAGGGLGEVQEAILNAVSPSSPRSAREIAAVTGKSLGTIRPHLRELVDLGLITATAPPTSRNRAYLRS